MWQDPVVEEVRAIRDAYARQFDYDIDAICRDLRAQEASCGHEVVSLPPRRVADESRHARAACACSR
jgi:hypothetical protein